MKKTSPFMMTAVASSLLMFSDGKVAFAADGNKLQKTSSSESNVVNNSNGQHSTVAAKVVNPKNKVSSHRRANNIHAQNTHYTPSSSSKGHNHNAKDKGSKQYDDNGSVKVLVSGELEVREFYNDDKEEYRISSRPAGNLQVQNYRGYNKDGFEMLHDIRTISSRQQNVVMPKGAASVDVAAIAKQLSYTAPTNTVTYDDPASTSDTVKMKLPDYTISTSGNASISAKTSGGAPIPNALVTKAEVEKLHIPDKVTSPTNKRIVSSADLLVTSGNVATTEIEKLSIPAGAIIHDSATGTMPVQISSSDVASALDVTLPTYSVSSSSSSSSTAQDVTIGKLTVTSSTPTTAPITGSGNVPVGGGPNMPTGSISGTDKLGKLWKDLPALKEGSIVDVARIVNPKKPGMHYGWATISNYGNYAEQYGMESGGHVSLRSEARTPIMGGLTFGGEITLYAQPGHLTHKFSESRVYEDHRIYVGGDYGYITAGYQKTADEEMRVDAEDISPGGDDWFRNTNVEGKDGTSPFYTRPGLYTETFYNGTNHLSSKIRDYDLANGLPTPEQARPISIAYYSPSLMGLKLGLSYIHEYNATSFMNEYDEFPTAMKPGIYDRYVDQVDGLSLSNERIQLAPIYENVVSAGLSYEYAHGKMNNKTSIKFSVTGEYGKSKKISDFDSPKPAYIVEYDDLAGVNVGLSLDYKGVKLAGSYGNILKSAVPKSVYNTAYGMALISGAMPSSDVTPFIGATNPYNIFRSKGENKNTHYWTAGVGYEYKGLGLTGVYFGSQAQESDYFHDVGVSLNYNLEVKNKAKLSPYISWHYFKTDQKDKRVIGYESSDYYNMGLASSGELYKFNHGKPVGTPSYSGNTITGMDASIGKIHTGHGYDDTEYAVDATTSTANHAVDLGTWFSGENNVSFTDATTAASPFDTTNDREVYELFRNSSSSNPKHVSSFRHKENNEGNVISFGLKFTF